MSKFSERLKRLREESNESRVEAAQQLGISRASLEYYEKSQRKPDIETLGKLADHYGVTTDYLLGRTDISETAFDPEVICKALYEIKKLSDFLYRYLGIRGGES